MQFHRAWLTAASTTQNVKLVRCAPRYVFLTMPISWRGTLAQCAGRLHRLHAAKREVVIFDYVDGHEPLLAKMATRREAGYRAHGYEVINAGDLFSPRNSALRKERRLISTVFWLGGVDELVDVARMA